MLASARRKAAAVAILLAVPSFATTAYGDPAASRCLPATEDGQLHRDEGKLRRARADFLECSNPRCPAVVRADCARWLDDVDARLPSLIVRARDAAGSEVFDVSVRLDGEKLADRLDGRLLTVDPGAHVLRFTRADGAEASVSTTFREGEKSRTLDVTLIAQTSAASPPAPPHRPAAAEAPATSEGRSLVVSAIFTGVAAAGGVVFAVLASGAKSDVDHLRGTCAPGCKSADIDAAHTKLVVANVALGVGVVALGAAVISYALASTRSTSTSAVAHAMAAGAAGASSGFRF